MKWCAIVCVGVVVGTLRAGAHGAVTEDEMINQCSELKAQEHLDLNEVMGKWYVVEVIEHWNEAARQGASSGGGVLATSIRKIDVCPIVKLREKSSGSHEGSPRFTLLWEENAGNLEYTFWLSKSRGPGVWNSDSEQNGTLVDNNPTYKRFVGTVHVMKAVASHLVLTFCSRDPQHRFTVLVAREHKLTKLDMEGVHKLLERRNLRIYNKRVSCVNGSAGPSQAPVHSLLLAAPLLVVLALRNALY